MKKENKKTKIELPKIKDLGTDLNYLTNYQKLWTLVKPLFCLVCFFTTYYYEYYFLSLLSIIFLQFNTFVSTSHDLVHNSLRLRKNWNKLFLSFNELICLRSGHAFKTSHLNHHKKFPSTEDIEGKSIYKSFFGTLLSGPTYIISIYVWSLKNCSKNDKAYILTEGILILLYSVVSILLIETSPVLLIFLILTYITSWVFPLFTVYIPHILNYEHPLFQTIKFKGPIISLIFAEHNYHLEHHLYPSVPHQNWKKLSKRLNSFIKDKEIKTISF